MSWVKGRASPAQPSPAQRGGRQLPAPGGEKPDQKADQEAPRTFFWEEKIFFGTCSLSTKPSSGPGLTWPRGLAPAPPQPELQRLCRPASLGAVGSPAAPWRGCRLTYLPFLTRLL